MKPAVTLTGSHVYGTPRPDSDLDIVVLVTDVQFEALRKYAPPDTQDYPDLLIKVGPLDLIIVKSQETYDAWVRGTEICKWHVTASQRQLTREEAVAVHQIERDKVDD